MQNLQKITLLSLFFNKVAGWKPEIVITRHWRCSVKKGVLKNLENLRGKCLCWCIFLIKLQFWRPATLLKKTLTKILSCKIWEIFKNNYFEEHLWTTACKLYLKKRLQHRCFLCELIRILICRESTKGWFRNISVGVSLSLLADL